MDEQATRHPLAWPQGWRRTLPHLRARARFSRVSFDATTTWQRKRQLSVADAIERLSGELRRLGAEREILSTNVQLRLDGLPRSDRAEPADPGAAVYFRLDGRPRCLATDRWDRVADNIAALAHHISAIRAVERYGVGTLEQAFAGYAALPPAGPEWWEVLALPATATPEEVETAFQRLAKVHHPDLPGGSHEAMTRLTVARDLARRAGS